MQYSYNWLKEISQTKKTAEEIAQLLLVHSFEVEELRDQRKGREDVVIGHVLQIASHPDADKLQIATVDVGEEKLQIVCGAPNLQKNQKVPVALVGAKLPNGLKIKKAKIRGIESRGMICAPDELDLGSENGGIMILKEDAPIGELFTTYKKLDDTILEIDVLPNRGHDALSHYGMAREIAMLEGRILNESHRQQQKYTQGIPVKILTPTCSRYCAISLSDIKIEPSPQWLQDKLTALGHNAINNVVDITNYIMLLTGQPIHAFQANFAPQITIRQAEKNEKVTLLDDTQLTLSKNDLLITDGKNPIALAGIMGGKSSAISNKTKEITLEIAHFDARTIRATKSRHNLHTDAAYRFERDIDPNLVDVAAFHAIKMFTEITGAKVKSITDIYPQESQVKKWSIALPHKEIEKILGTQIDQTYVQSILKNLDITLTQKNDVYLCHIPTIRRDLQSPEDLIEEIGRVYGYDKIKPKPLKEPVTIPHHNAQREYENHTKDLFVAEGYSEIKSYSYYAKNDAKQVGLNGKHITVLNPMSSEQEYMRRTLAVGILKSAAKNNSFTEESKLFEVGRFYIPSTSQKLPQEKMMLGLAYTKKSNRISHFHTLKGSIENFLTEQGLHNHYFSDDIPNDLTDAIIFHPTRQAFIRLDNNTICGVIGEIPKRTAKYFGIKNAQTIYAEIDLAVIEKAAKSNTGYQPLPKYPAVTRDLSMRVGKHTRVADIERTLSASAGNLLSDINLFDLYENKKNGERSMAFHILFQSQKKTLTADEVDVLIKKMILAVEKIADVEVKKI